MAKRKLAEVASEKYSKSSPPTQDSVKQEPAIDAPPNKKRKVNVKDEVAEDNKEVVKDKKRGKTKALSGSVLDTEPGEDVAKKAKQKKGKKKIIAEEASDEDANSKVAKKTPRKRKTKEEKEAEAMPLAARTTGRKLFIGAHVSAAGGVHNSVLNSVHIGANAFALFLKSQRKWANPPLVDEHRTTFINNCKSHTYSQHSHVVPHGSYLVNLAHTDKARTEQAYDSFLDDLQRCEKLGIKLYNFHPGVANSVNGDRQAAIAHLASNLNRAHKATSTVVTLLENMAHGGNTLGSTFEDLRDTIALIHNRSRVGVCLDTCHAFAGGYDLRTPAAFKATLASFDEIVGIQYLRAVHMNDSKAPFASHRDLHANIGTGFIGLRAFHSLVNDSRFEELPLILETPLDAKDENGVHVKDEKGKVMEDKGVWAREIKLLESLVGMDVEGEEFLKLERDLARKGEPQRRKMEEQIEKKREKDAKRAERAGKKKKGKKSKGEESEDDELSDLEDGVEEDLGD